MKAQTDMDKNALLDFLVAQKVVPKDQEQRIRDAQLKSGETTERVVLELGLSDEEDLYSACANFFSVGFLKGSEFEPSNLEADLISIEFMRRSSLVLFQAADGSLQFGTSHLDHSDQARNLSFLLGKQITGQILSPSTLSLALSHVSKSDVEDHKSATEGDIERLKALANDGPVVKYTNDMIARAVTAGTSDVHIEATSQGARVRYRIDGALETDGEMTEAFRDALVSRIKVVADLNMSEKRKPQDGRMASSVRGRNVDIRISTLPTQFGESVVLRILDQSRVELDWQKLGFSPQRTAQVRKLLEMPNGIFLVAGPTGSGKTTTLYTALNEMNSPDRKILTVEDPIEYTLDGINQVQVDHKIGMDFANALRAILRQDPDIVLVGEIRDQETAEIAVRAALIGRTVLSTIHTNDSPSAVDRLLDLGIAPYLVAATLRGVLSQRLVRHVRSDGQTSRELITQLLTMDPATSDAISTGSRGLSLAEIVRRSESLVSDPGFG